MNQQRQLLEPFPPSVVKKVDKGFGQINFVSWTDKIQRLLQVLGGFDWSVSEPFPSGDKNEPVAVKGRLTATVAGEMRVVEGIGTDRDAKKAETDAFARACSKLGLGLHLWTQGGDKDGGYWLPTVMDREDTDEHS